MPCELVRNATIVPSPTDSLSTHVHSSTEMRTSGLNADPAEGYEKRWVRSHKANAVNGSPETISLITG